MDKKIAYIIPLHKKDDRVFRAIKSVSDGTQVIVVAPEKISDWTRSKKTTATVISAGKHSSYPTLVNIGLSSINDDIDYVNILEFDDVLMPNAHRIINEYANDWDDVEILAPLACVVTYSDQSEDDKPILVGIANEAPMAPQVAEEFGYLDFNMMLRTNFLFANGCYIKPSVFKDYGKFKENFEIFYDYEWALRVVYNGGIIRSIPKATHFHQLTQDGAFETQKSLPKEVRENWLGAARREYFFENDRPINFD